MCRFSKDADEKNCKNRVSVLERRTIEELWSIDDHSLLPANSNIVANIIGNSVQIAPSSLCLSDEIDNLIRWNRERSIH